VAEIKIPNATSMQTYQSFQPKKKEVDRQVLK